MKKCPFCAEEIQNEAIVCRYCGRELEQELPAEDRKKCPHCAEWIRAEALVCRYCGRDLVDEDKAIPEVEEPVVREIPPEEVETTRPWYRQTWFYVFSLLFLGPLFVILVGTDKKAPSWAKFFYWIAILIWIGICVSVFVLVTTSIFPQFFSNISANIPSSSSEATKTPRIWPTARSTSTPWIWPAARPTSTPWIWPTASILDTCTSTRWYQIDNSFEGKYVCVYGIARRVVIHGDYWGPGKDSFTAYFSENNDDFGFYPINSFISGEGLVGHCVEIYGKLKLVGSSGSKLRLTITDIRLSLKCDF